MIFGLFRRASNDAVIDRLYLSVVAASRQPPLYADLHVPDTFEGRFESLALARDPGAAASAKLRGARAGDGAAPRRHRVQAFRSHAPRDGRGRHHRPQAHEDDGGSLRRPQRRLRCGPARQARALADALARNVYAGKRDAAALTDYVEAAVAALAMTPLQAFVDGAPRFPDATSFVREPT